MATKNSKKMTPKKTNKSKMLGKAKKLEATRPLSISSLCSTGKHIPTVTVQV
jgi:hypothetical protein